MTLKTLREIADEVGFPFEADRKDSDIYCVAITPLDVAIGWDKHGAAKEWRADRPFWTLVTPKKKLVEYLYDYDGKSSYGSAWCRSEEAAKEWCANNDLKFIKVLREIEI